MAAVRGQPDVPWDAFDPPLITHLGRRFCIAAAETIWFPGRDKGAREHLSPDAFSAHIRNRLAGTSYFVA